MAGRHEQPCARRRMAAYDQATRPSGLGYGGLFRVRCGQWGTARRITLTSASWVVAVGQQGIWSDQSRDRHACLSSSIRTLQLAPRATPATRQPSRPLLCNSPSRPIASKHDNVAVVLWTKAHTAGLDPAPPKKGGSKEQHLHATVIPDLR